MADCCNGCKWWDDFTWACFNGDSPYCADFVNCGCKHFEREKENVCQRPEKRSPESRCRK